MSLFHSQDSRAVGGVTTGDPHPQPCLRPIHELPEAFHLPLRISHVCLVCLGEMGEDSLQFQIFRSGDSFQESQVFFPGLYPDPSHPRIHLHMNIGLSPHTLCSRLQLPRGVLPEYGHAHILADQFFIGIGKSVTQHQNRLSDPRMPQFHGLLRRGGGQSPHFFHFLYGPGDGHAAMAVAVAFYHCQNLCPGSRLQTDVLQIGLYGVQINLRIYPAVFPLPAIHNFFFLSIQVPGVPHIPRRPPPAFRRSGHGCRTAGQPAPQPARADILPRLPPQKPPPPGPAEPL